MQVKPENIVLSVNERKMLQKNAEKYHEKHAMMQKITLDEFQKTLTEVIVKSPYIVNTAGW